MSLLLLIGGLFFTTIAVHEITHYMVAYLMNGKPRFVLLKHGTPGVTLQNEFNDTNKYGVFFITPFLTVFLALILLLNILDEIPSNHISFVAFTISLLASSRDITQFIRMRREHAA